MKQYREGQKQMMRTTGMFPVAVIAEAAGVDRGTVYRLFREGRLRGVKQGRACWIELKSALEVWGELVPVREALAALGGT